MNLVVVFLGVLEFEAEFHSWGVLHSMKVVVPRPRVGNHEEAQEEIREQHLHLLIKYRGVPLGIHSLLSVCFSPFKACRGHFVSS